MRIARASQIFAIASAIAAATPNAAISQCQYEVVSGPEFGNTGLGFSSEGAHAMVRWDPDGSGPEEELLVVGGDFRIAGHLWVDRIAAWDGRRFHRLGDGFNGKVRCLYVYGGQLIAGGDFDRAGTVPAKGIAKWDGTQWSAMDAPFLGIAMAYSFAEYGGNLVMGGEYGVYHWINNQWVSFSPLYQVRCLTVYQNELYAGGKFVFSYSPEDPLTYGIARWNGAEWKKVGTGVQGDVNGVLAMAVQSDTLIAAGVFQRAGGVTCNSLARWNGQVWSAIPHEFNGYYGYTPQINSLYVDGGHLIVGGNFYWFDEYEECTNIAEFSDGRWKSLDVGLIGFGLPVRSMMYFRGELMAAGDFYRSNELIMDGIARFDGNSWKPIGRGVDSIAGYVIINDSCEWREKLVLAGRFLQVDSDSTNGVAFWDGQILTPSPDLSSIEIDATTVCVYQGDLVVGGWFYVAPENYNIARFDGQMWRPIGNGINNKVWAVCSRDQELFASITHEGGPNYASIKKWDGAQWTSIGSFGNTGAVATKLQLFQGKIIAAGNFSYMNGISGFNGIGSWDGAQWSKLSSGLQTSSNSPGIVYGVTVYNDSLVVSGNFTKAGGIPANNIARWNGTTWSPMGSGLPNGAGALGIHNNELYAVTNYTGSQPWIPGIARWDGESWHVTPLTGFYAPWFTRLIDFRNELYLLGRFDGRTQDNEYAFTWAKFLPSGPLPTITQHPASPAICQGSAISLRSTATGDGSLTYQWRMKGIDLADDEDTFGTNTNTLVFAHAAASDAGPYDCLVKLDNCTQSTSNTATLSVFPTNTADGNLDGLVDARDIAILVEALTSFAPVSAPLCAFDLTGEGIVNPDDIPPFVTRLLAK